MSKKKAFKNATEEIQYIGAMLTATTQADTKRIDAAIKRLREINYQDPKPLIDAQRAVITFKPSDFPRFTTLKMDVCIEGRSVPKTFLVLE